MATLTYTIGSTLYLNITNRCTNHCDFCIKWNSKSFFDTNLFLAEEPGLDEIMAAVHDAPHFSEAVFCGYGESLIRLDMVLETAEAIAATYRVPIRINTDGQANLFHGRNIIPELSDTISALSVSLNAHNAETYQQLCHSPFGHEAFSGVCDFIRLAAQTLPSVTASVVRLPTVDIEASRTLAHSFGARFRVRSWYHE